MDQQQLIFGPFRFDETNECLWRGSQAIPLRPKAFAVLKYLISHKGVLVTKQQLLNDVWPRTYVSEAVLKDCIRQLRHALNDDAKTPHTRAIKLGQWLSAKVGREIPVCVGGRNGNAVLRVIKGRSRETKYYVEVTWARAQKPQPPSPKKVAGVPPKKKETQKETPKTATKPAGTRKPTTSGNDEEW